MPADNNIKALSEELCKEVLDDIANKIKSGEVDNKPRYWESWEEMITVYYNMRGADVKQLTDDYRRSETKRFTYFDMESAVKLAVEKTKTAVSFNQEKINKLIIENAIEEIYRELHNNKKYNDADLVLGTRIVENIRRMCKADFQDSPKGYLTKIERERKTIEHTVNQIDDILEKIEKESASQNSGINEFAGGDYKLGFNDAIAKARSEVKKILKEL